MIKTMAKTNSDYKAQILGEIILLIYYITFILERC